MSEHRASTAQSVPSFGNLPQPSPQQFPQPSADWFSTTERLRVDREKRAHAGSFAGVISSDDIAMSFGEIADQTGMTRQTVQYVFNRAMKKSGQNAGRKSDAGSSRPGPPAGTHGAPARAGDGRSGRGHRCNSLTNIHAHRKQRRDAGTMAHAMTAP